MIKNQFYIFIRGKQNVQPVDLDQVIKSMTRHFFTAFVRSYLVESRVEGMMLQQGKETMLDKINSFLWQILLVRISDDTGQPSKIVEDTGITFAKYVNKNSWIQNIEDFRRYSHSWLEENSLQSIPPLYTTCPLLLEFLLSAVEQVTAELPLRIFVDKIKISQEEIALLFETLNQINEIRSMVPGWVRPISKVFRQTLKINIARANDNVWLPLKPLITAALSTQEDMEFYSRSTVLTEKLARHVLYSEGVILVTGYRGVGKTTFVNAILDKYIPDILKRPSEDPNQEVIHIHINVAKEDSIKNVLRLCIRALYEVFYNREHAEDGRIGSILTNDERLFLEWSNLCASYTVNLSQSNDISQFTEMQETLGIKPAELLPKSMGGGLLGLLPSIEAKIGKSWNEKLSHTISLMDYDEDRAEEDIRKFIEMVTVKREKAIKAGKRDNKPLKLAFVFDELDKMDLVDQENILKKLKNLFLTRNSIFFLITSKDFYYRLIANRAKEDSILGSYFSSIFIVPVLSSADTSCLIENFIQIPDGVSRKEKEMINTLAKYVTYQAGGISREIIRELQAIMIWSGDSPSPFITDQIVSIPNVQVYAHIQDALEKLFEMETGQLIEINSGASAPFFAPGNAQSMNAEAVQNITEEEDSYKRFLSDDGCRDQMKRGLYIVVEQLLDSRSIVFSTEVVQKIHEELLNTISILACKSLMNALIHSLENISIPQEGGDPISLFNIPQEFPTSSKEALVPKIKVLEAFYALTGRQPTIVPSKNGQNDTNITPDELSRQIRNLLSQSEDKQKLAVALGRLKILREISDSKTNPVPVDIQQVLYQIFITPGTSEYQLQAADGISGPVFSAEVKKKTPDDFINNESNDPVIFKFFDLVWSGLGQNDPKLATRLILDLLLKHTKNKLPLTKPTILNAGKILQAVVPENVNLPDPIIDAVLDNLDPTEILSRQMVDGVLQPLSRKINIDLLKKLLLKNFAEIQDESLSKLLMERKDEELLTLWEELLRNEDKKLAQKLMTSVLIRLAKTDYTTIFLDWLNSKDWSDTDQRVLETASKEDRQILHRFAEKISKDNSQYVLALERVEKIILQNSQHQQQPEPVQTVTSPSPKTGLNWMRVLVYPLLILVTGFFVFFILPIDISADISLGGRLLNRLLELVYLICWAGAVILGIWGLTNPIKQKNKLITAVVFLIIGAACLTFLITVLQAPITTVGQASLLGIILATLVALVIYILFSSGTFSKSDSSN